MLIFKKVSKNLCILFHIRHLLDFRTSICFTTILSTPIYHMVLICTSRCPQLLRPNLLTTCKNKLSAKSASHFENLISIKCLVIHGLHARPMFFPYHSSPLCQCTCYQNRAMPISHCKSLCAIFFQGHTLPT